ncbi:MAG: dephospho-CoA kinase [Mailhella sp.]|nr:dephospho-CoA kinase [Mailhella sp.]
MEEQLGEMMDQDDVCSAPAECGGIRSFTVPDGGRVWLDAFLSAASGESRSRMKRWIAEGRCTVGGAPAADADVKLRPGDEVTLRIPGAAAGPEAEDGPLDVVYADADIAVVAKPAGLTIHPCPSCPAGTLVNRLLRRFPQLAAQDGPRPGIVHRLDKDTSGLVVIALTERARLRLVEDFAARRVHKTYLAVTRGVPPAEGSGISPIGRHPTVKTRMAVVPLEKGGREAFTEWETLYASPLGRFSLLAVRLHTGRTHQIRVHLAEKGFPLWGDTVYGPASAGPAARQMLHAWRLEFGHPVTGEPMSFLCPPPPDFAEAMLALERGAQRIVLTGMPGCGKSAVLERISGHGIPVWSADAAVAAQYRPGADGWHLMRQRWGDLFMAADGSVDRIRLGELLAGTPGMRRDLERLIHPLVYDDMRAFFLKADRDGAAAAVAAVPVGLETAWHRRARTGLAVVSCGDAVRHARLGASRGWSPEKTAAVDSWQWRQADKIAAADDVIPNEGTRDELDAAVDRFLRDVDGFRAADEAARRELWAGLWSSMPSPAEG